MIAFRTRVHGWIDYGIGALSIASPWLFGFADTGEARGVAIAAGVFLIAYSLLTNYELGVARAVQIPAHLWLDGLLGLLLAISPWLLDFDQQVWIPHVVLGASLIVIAVFSRTIPDYERRGSGGRTR